MKSKNIMFAIAMFMPNLAWACADDFFNESKLEIAFIVLIISSIAIIIASLFSAFKKDEENKKLKWWIIFAVVFLVLDLAISYVYSSTVEPISFAALFIVITILAFKKNKKDKILKWLMIFAICVLILSFLMMIIVGANISNVPCF